MNDRFNPRHRPLPPDETADSRYRLATELRDCRKMLDDTEHVARIGNWRFDIARRQVLWSAETARILELDAPPPSAHEIFLSRIHADDRERVARAYSAALQGDGVQEVEYRLAFPDGRIKDVRERRVVCYGPNGLISCISGTVQDMTESRLAEAMLQGEKSRLRTFLDSIPDLVWIKDTDGVYLACNPVFERFLGAREHDIAGRTDADFVDAALAWDFRQKDQETMATGQARVDEEWVRFAHDGRCALLETIRTPLRDDWGNIAGVLGIARDITERKRMEELLHLREQEFRTIAENSPDPIARYDAECRCIYMNPALQKLLGKNAHRFVGKTPLEGSAGKDHFRSYEECIREAIRSGEETELELIAPALRKGGRTLCDHVRFTPERDREGRVVSVLAVGRDIARFKEAERALSQSGHQLRTLLVRQEQDREAERKRVAWEVHEELGQLLAALRFELLRRHEGTTAGAPALHILDHAFRIVRGLTASLRPRVLDFGIDAALEWLSGEFAHRTGVPCALRCLSTDALDEDRVTVLFRAAQEALDNVERHAAARQVEMTLERSTDAHVLTVKDDGKGFDPALPIEGGFGLLLIQERARAVQGALSVTSAPGKGTTLEIRIPQP